MASMTDELIFKLYFILMNLNLYSHMKLVAVAPDSTDLESRGSKH